MSAIRKITDTITRLLNTARTPITPIPAILLLCNVLKRSGGSPLMAASNIIKRQSEFGAPTGQLPDGSENKMNALIYVITDEVMKEIRNNCVIESVIGPGEISVTGISGKGFNDNIVKLRGILR